MSGPGSMEELRQAAAVVIPTFNAEASIGEVVEAARAQLEPVVVVDDGSRDRSAEVAEAAGARVLRHPTNAGKGAALKAGFRHLAAQEKSIAVTLDADGQHDPSMIPVLLERFLAVRAPLVLGCRSLDQIPPLRRFGNAFSNFWLRVGTGYRHLPDSQSGFRVYDLEAIPDEVLFGNGPGFEYEYHVLLGLSEHDLPVDFVTIPTIYGKYPEVASNYRALRDSFRIVFRFLGHMARRRLGR